MDLTPIHYGRVHNQCYTRTHNPYNLQQNTHKHLNHLLAARTRIPATVHPRKTNAITRGSKRPHNMQLCQNNSDSEGNTTIATATSKHKTKKKSKQTTFFKRGLSKEPYSNIQHCNEIRQRKENQSSPYTQYKRKSGSDGAASI